MFHFFGEVLTFLNNLKFTAFGYEFSYLGIFIAFIICVMIFKLFRFGFESDVGESLKFARDENKKKNEYTPRHARPEYVPRHGKND